MIPVKNNPFLVRFARLHSKSSPLLVSRTSLWRPQKSAHHNLFNFPSFIASLFTMFYFSLNKIKFSWTKVLLSMRLFINNNPSFAFRGCRQNAIWRHMSTSAGSIFARGATGPFLLLFWPLLSRLQIVAWLTIEPKGVPKASFCASIVSFRNLLGNRELNYFFLAI